MDNFLIVLLTSLIFFSCKTTNKIHWEVKSDELRAIDTLLMDFSIGQRGGLKVVELDSNRYAYFSNNQLDTKMRDNNLFFLKKILKDSTLNNVIDGQKKFEERLSNIIYVMDRNDIIYANFNIKEDSNIIGFYQFKNYYRLYRVENSNIFHTNGKIIFQNSNTVVVKPKSNKQ